MVLLLAETVFIFTEVAGNFTVTVQVAIFPEVVVTVTLQEPAAFPVITPF